MTRAWQCRCGGATSSERNLIVIEPVVARRCRRGHVARGGSGLRPTRRAAFAAFPAAAAAHAAFSAATGAAAEHLHFIGDDVGAVTLLAVLFVFLGAQF